MAISPFRPKSIKHITKHIGVLGDGYCISLPVPRQIFALINEPHALNQKKRGKWMIITTDEQDGYYLRKKRSNGNLKKVFLDVQNIRFVNICLSYFWKKNICLAGSSHHTFRKIEIWCQYQAQYGRNYSEIGTKQRKFNIGLLNISIISK